MLKKHQNQISIVDFENVLSTEIILRATIQNKFSKSRNFQDKNLWWNSALVKLFFFFFLQFTVILLMNDSETYILSRMYFLDSMNLFYYFMTPVIYLRF